MNQLKIIEILHRHPLLFKILLSAFLPLKIDRRFKYNKHLTLASINLYTDTLDSNKSSVWQSILFPTEIFHSMNISPFVIEMTSSILAKMNLSNRLISLMECAGLTRELCSFHKCAAGAVRSGLIPVPEMIVTSSEVCDSIRKIGEFYSKISGTSHFYLDVPFTKTEESLLYVKEQLSELIKWLEVNSGKKFSEEKFSESIKYSNSLRKNMMEVMELRREYPGIMGYKPVFGLFNFSLFYGSSEGVRISEILLRELKEKARSWRPSKDLVKILWLHFTPFYKEEFTEVLEKNGRVSVVFEEMNNIYWKEVSEENPLESMAERIFLSPFCGSVQNRLEKILSLCDFYDVAGVIHFSHLSCRKCNGGLRVIKDVLKEKNILFLDLSGDCIDSRNYSEGPLKTRLEAFLELFE